MGGDVVSSRLAGSSTGPSTGPSTGRPPGRPAPVLVVGRGNVLRGDDAVGPFLARYLGERGVPDGVEVLDAGTTGIDAVLAMRGRRKVIVVDAARTGGEPGTRHRIPGEHLPALTAGRGLDLHTLRWDHALAAGRALPGEAGP